MAATHPIYDLEVTSLDGSTHRMDRYRGQVVLIVNVASRCGYTPQYAWLERVYRTYLDRGAVVLGFPCNQFGAQEPGSADEIREFCREAYDVTFPLFAKVDVNGAGAHPLFVHLKRARPGWLWTPGIKWNFTKFLVDGEGHVRARYGPSVGPDAIEAAIGRLLDAAAAQAGASESA